MESALDDRRLAPHSLRFPLSEDLDLPLKSKYRSSALNKVTESFLLAEAAELALWEEDSLSLNN